MKDLTLQKLIHQCRICRNLGCGTLPRSDCYRIIGPGYHMSTSRLYKYKTSSCILYPCMCFVPRPQLIPSCGQIPTKSRDQWSIIRPQGVYHLSFCKECMECCLCTAASVMTMYDCDHSVFSSTASQRSRTMSENNEWDCAKRSKIADAACFPRRT